MVKNSIRRTISKTISHVATPEILAAACKAESRPWVRRRLAAVRYALLGHSDKAAARLSGASSGSVVSWRAIVEKYGWQALGRYRQTDTRRKEISPGRANKLISEIARFLEAGLDVRERRRMVSVYRVLAGQDIDTVAKATDSCPATIREWLRKLRRGGVVALRNKPPAREPLLDANADGLRALALQQQDRRLANALLAMACLADGQSAHEAGLQVRLAPATITKWLKAFRADGLNGLRQAMQPKPSDASACKLKPNQKAELAAIIAANPKIARTELWTTVRVRYGADYTMRGLLRLVREDLGFVSVGR